MRALLVKLMGWGSRRFVAAVFLGAFALRVAFVLVWQEDLGFPDSATYDAIAQNFSQGHGLILDKDWQVTRPPLYPLFLAGCYEVFGRNFLVVGIVQAAAGALCCVLMLALGEKALDPLSGRLAAIIGACYPYFIFFCGPLLTETLFTLCLVAAVTFLARAQRGALGWVVAAGATVGAGTLIRSSLYLFWAFLAPFWLLGLGGGKKRAAASFAVGTLALGVMLIPWGIRNYRVTGGHFVPTTLQVGRSLYEANSPLATGGPAMHRIDWEAEKDGAKLSEYEDDLFFRNKALTYIRTHPGRTLRLAVVKLARFWNPIPNDEGYRSFSCIAVSLLSHVPILLFAGIGLIRQRSDLSRCGLLLLPVLYFALLHMVFVGSVRYRTPVMPFVILFAASGIRSAFWPSDED